MPEQLDGQITEFLVDDISFGLATAFGVRGFVYVVVPAGVVNVVKIGNAINLRARLAALQCSAWEPLGIVAALGVEDADPASVERGAHAIARKQGAHRIGEWFNLSVESAIETVIQAARAQRATVYSIPDLIRRDVLQNAMRVQTEKNEQRAQLKRKLGID